MKTFCIYHRIDLDGKCSAAIVRRAIPDCELVPYNYGDDLDLEQFRGHKVVMVDCSLQPYSRMLELEELCDLTWIDHHKTAIEWYLEAGAPTILGSRAIGTAGCELTWKYFFPQKDMPLAVWLLGRYDVWDLEADPRVLAFQYGMRQLPWDPDYDRWDELFPDDPLFSFVDELCNQGSTILGYARAWNKNACKSAFPATIDGLDCICMNMPRGSSQVFESVWDQEKYDAMLVYFNSGNKHWTVSLYTDKPGIDVSEVAKARGGGGHQGAAGFQCQELPPQLQPVGIG